MNEIVLALRRLARRPSFTLPAVATLAVGIGATTAIFSTVNAALLRPPPYPQSEDIYALRSARIDGGWSNGYVSNAELQAVVSAVPSVSHAAGMRGSGTDVLVTDDGRNRRITVRVITNGFFELVGVPLAVGAPTALEGGEDSYGAVVLSHRIWDQVYARDPDIVGSTIRFLAASATVVGVAPPDFDLPDDTDVWEIFAPSPTADAKGFLGWLRVRPGTNPEVLRSELAAVMAGRVENGLEDAGSAFVATPLVDSIVGDLAPILWIALAAAAVLLALGCANVAALILAREAAQSRELAIRKALGATRGRVLRQVLAEALLLSAVGTGAGLSLAYLGVRALPMLGADGLPRLEAVPFDAGVLTAACATMLLTATLVGLLPMARLARQGVRPLLGRGGPSVAGHRGSRSALSTILVAEVAMALVAVMAAGWLVRSYSNLVETDPGFVPEGRLVFQTMLVGSSYMPIQRLVHSDNFGIGLVPDPRGDTPETWLEDLRTRLEELDEFRAVGMGSAVPFRSEPPAIVYVSVPGRTTEASAPDLARFRFASPDFFGAMGTPLLAGRPFTDDDPPTAVVVNEAFVRAFLAGRNPVGLTFGTGLGAGRGTGDVTSEQTIVGVVADVRYESLRESDPPALYTRDYLPTQFVVVSTSLADPTPIIPAVRAAVEGVESGIPIAIEPVAERIADELARHRLGLILISLFGAVSLFLAGIGIHGVVGHSTSLRSKEFAVRIAVGATPSTIASSLLTNGAVLWALGISIGVGLGYLAGRVGSSRLYEVRPLDPSILTVAVCAVSALTIAAFLFAAVRGSRVNPGVLLNAE